MGSLRRSDRRMSVMACMALLIGLLTGGCRTGPRADGAPSQEVTAAVEDTINRLYEAFCFDAGGEADWDTIRELAMEGAVFVAPIRSDRRPTGADLETFLADFKNYVASEPVRTTGLHERIVRSDIGLSGGIAHAWVAFVGIVPGETTPQSRGVDSVQLVQTEDGWRVASFTTQYVTPPKP